LVRHRLGQTRQRLPLVSRPEGELGQVEAPERGRSADTAAACRGALDGAPQARPAALVVGRLIKDQLVGVACLP
ncbi:Ribosome-associated protein, partial [Dysosmobacter welbionis]